MASAAPEIDPRYHVAAAERTMVLLDAVSRTSPATISGLAHELGWTKPMVFRLVRTLQTTGALCQDESGYSLGPMMISLGYAALQSLSLVDAAKPIIADAHARTGESVVLTILDGTDIVYVDFLETDHLLVLRARIGARLPAYLTSSGHALLCRHSDESLRLLFDGYIFKPPTPHSVSSVDVLIRRLSATRKRGYALIDQELTLGHRSVAAPVLDHTGAVAAAISVSVPTARVSLNELNALARDVLLPATHELSRRLGASDTDLA